jgi:hypothetical protein
VRRLKAAEDLAVAANLRPQIGKLQVAGHEMGRQDLVSMSLFPGSINAFSVAAGRATKTFLFGADREGA